MPGSVYALCQLPHSENHGLDPEDVTGMEIGQCSPFDVLAFIIST